MVEECIARLDDAKQYAMREVKEITGSSCMSDQKLCNLHKAVDIIRDCVETKLIILANVETFAYRRCGVPMSAQHVVPAVTTQTVTTPVAAPASSVVTPNKIVAPVVETVRTATTFA